MFPIGDSDVKESGPGLITILLVVINVLVFLAEITLFRSDLRGFFNQYGVIPARILDGERLYSLFTSIFLHGGWFHLISNMVFLLVFGDNVEAALGKLLYPIFYLLGGLAASALFIAMRPDGTLPSLGASGAIGAILGSYIVMFPSSQVRVLLVFGFFFTIRRIAAVFFLGLWFVMQLFSGVAGLGAQTAQSGGVAVWAHVGGFVFGLLMGFAFKKRAEDLTLERDVRRRR